MSVNHYENFPVASILLPRELRRPIATIYHFARTADDLADEGDVPSEARLAALANYRTALEHLAEGQPAQDPLFQALGATIRDFGLPMQPFYDLLSAFEQDVVTNRYPDFQALMDYCRRSANPVGRLVLALAMRGKASFRSLEWSDHICTALQLINFWQDVAIDWGKGTSAGTAEGAVGRVYLPQNELALFDLADADIAAFSAGQPCSPRWQEMMRFQTKRARQLMRSGIPLIGQLPGRLGWEIQLTVMGGLRILDKIDACQGDVFRHRPVLTKVDWLQMLWKLLRSRLRKDRSWLK